MGASREKRVRKTITQQNQANKKKKEETSSLAIRILAGFVIVLVVFGVAAVILYAANIPQRLFAAMTVGDIKVTPAEYNVYYMMVRNDVYTEWQNNSQDPTSQENAANFILEVQYKTEQNIQSTVALADVARKNGAVLSDDNKTYLDSQLSSLSDGAREQSISVGQYLEQIYGKGVTQTIYEKYLNDSLLANQWITAQVDTFTHDQAEYDAYYAENRDAVDTLDFRCYVSAPETLGDDATDEEKTAAQDAAKAKAQAIVDGSSSEDAFVAAVLENASESEKEGLQNDPDTTLSRNVRITELGNADSYAFSWVNEEQRTWLVDPARKAGDVTLTEYGEGQYFIVFFYLSRQRPDYYPVNVRHILFQFKDDEDAVTTTPTDEQKAAAKQKADDELAKWKAGEATEDSFAALADADTDDTGNVSSDGSTNGGLYQGILKGAMVAPFEAWCFDTARKPGDTGIVETSYGFHVMYFVSNNETLQWINIVKGSMATDDVNNYLESTNANYPLVKKDYGMSMTIKE